MATERRRNDFLNFILDTENKPKMAKEFLAKNTAKELYSFFQKNGYKDIPEYDCRDILATMKRMRGVYVPKHGEPLCAGVTKGY